MQRVIRRRSPVGRGEERSGGGGGGTDVEQGRGEGDEGGDEVVPPASGGGVDRGEEEGFGRMQGLEGSGEVREPWRRSAPAGVGQDQGLVQVIADSKGR